MKKFIAIMVAIVFVLSIVALCFAEDKCATCHKGEKALDKVVAAKGIKTSADFVAKAKANKVHAKLTDDEIKASAAALKLP